MKLTEEQFNKLSPYKEYLDKAFKIGYTQGIRRETIKAVYAVYKEMQPKELLQENCGQCVFRIFSKLGQMMAVYEESIVEQPKQKRTPKRPAKRTKKDD